MHIALAWLQYGKIEEMNVCDNLGDHLVGNVYIKVGGSLSHNEIFVSLELVKILLYLKNFWHTLPWCISCSLQLTYCYYCCHVRIRV